MPGEGGGYRPTSYFVIGGSRFPSQAAAAIAAEKTTEPVTAQGVKLDRT